MRNRGKKILSTALAVCMIGGPAITNSTLIGDIRNFGSITASAYSSHVSKDGLYDYIIDGQLYITGVNDLTLYERVWEPNNLEMLKAR